MTSHWFTVNSNPDEATLIKNWLERRNDISLWTQRDINGRTIQH